MKRRAWLFLPVMGSIVMAACGAGMNGGGGGSGQVAAQLAVTAPANATAGTPFNFTVTALDASGAIVARYSGTVHFASTDPQALLPADSALTNGTGTFSATLKTATGESLAAADTVNSSISGHSSLITVNAGSAASLGVSAPSNAAAGTSFNFTVTAFDAWNNTANSYTGTVKFTSTDAQAVLPGPAQLTNGTGTFSATLRSNGNQTITATDATNSVAGTTGTIKVSTPVTLSITSGPLSNGTANEAYGPTQIPYLCVLEGGYGGFSYVCTPCIPIPGLTTCTASWRAHDHPGFVLSASGGTPPYRWHWAPQAGSAIPSGLYLDSTYGIISGTPTTPGTYNVTVTVGDAAQSGDNGSANYTIVVAVPPPPVVNATPAPSIGTLNSPYSSTFTASEGLPPLTWSETGALPSGLSLSSGGVLSGTPTQAGQFPIAVTAKDSGGQSSAPQDFTIQVLSQGFSPTGTMETPRAVHTATLLGSGKVLVAGGVANETTVLASAELYDPGSGTFSATGNMETARAGHKATLLEDGTVLITGGTTSSKGINSAEIYDPSTGVFTPTGNMVTARVYHTATLLQDGRVLLTGGEDDTGQEVASAEIYNPSSKSFSATGSMANIRSNHTATLLANGKVLVAGGSSSTTTELFDPSTGTFSVAGAMQTARTYHAATLLNDGRVLLTGGYDATGTALASAEIYDASSGSFSSVGSMVSARYLHTATLLGSTGQVLVAGGNSSDLSVLSASELFDPASNTFSSTADMTSSRTFHTATLLPNGEVLVAGGENAPVQPVATAEVYQ